MRRSILFATTAGLALALSACGGSSTEETTAEESTGAEETTAAEGGDASLVIWVDENRQAGVQAAADQFTADTGTSVELVVKNFDDIRADFLAQVPTGEGPDITVGSHDWLGEFMTNGVVAPVELGDSAADYNSVAVDAFTYDGQVYGLPYGLEAIGLIRNTDLAPDAPTTYDEMISMGEAAGTTYPFLIQIGEEGDPYHMYPFQASFGAPVFTQNDDGSYSTELALGGENGEAFAQWLAEEGANGHLDTAITPDIASEAFANGESAFIIGGPWLITDFADLNIEVTEIPSAGGETASPFVGVQGFYVSAQSENTIVATDFLVNYIGTEEVQTALYEADNRIPALTASADALTDPVAEGFAAVVETAVPMPSIPEMSEVWAFWGVTQAAIINGTEEPVTAWQKMVSDIEAAIAG